VEKALSLDPADTTALGIHALFEKDKEKRVQLYKSLLTNNPSLQREAHEYRLLTRKRNAYFDYLLIISFTLLSLAFFLFPQMLDVHDPKRYLWLYLPAALVVGRNWRRSFLFFLVNCVLLSQIEAQNWLKWQLMATPFLAAGFSLKFYIINLLFTMWGRNLRAFFDSLQLHRRQDTFEGKILEQLGEIANSDSLLVLLGSLSIYLVSLDWFPGWVGLGGLLPLLCLIKYWGRKGANFVVTLPPLLWGNIFIILVGRTISPWWLSVVPVVFLILLQLYMVHRLYLRKVFYVYD